MLTTMLAQAKEAARALATFTRAQKDAALLRMADELEVKTDWLLEANGKDLKAGKEKNISAPLLERLTLTRERVAEMAKGLRDIAAAPDPVGQGVSRHRSPTGLDISAVRVPLGVVALVYESRPNVTADGAALCLKSGNAAMLRGGREAKFTNRAIADLLIAVGLKAGLPQGFLTLIDGDSRAVTEELIALEGLDLLIPRGGKGLKATVSKLARSPYVMTGMGLCHLFIDESADPKKALDITLNAKTQRPSVCNAIETLLVHEQALDQLEQIIFALRERGVTLVADETVASKFGLELATDEDWDEEYLDLKLSIKAVNNIDEALAHISAHGTGHSEAIVTENYANAEYFLNSVDAAAVYVNASTRFTDGGQFGLGAEMGISTQKVHARGPMGLQHLTTVKYQIRGKGQIR